MPSERSSTRSASLQTSSQTPTENSKRADQARAPREPFILLIFAPLVFRATLSLMHPTLFLTLESPRHTIPPNDRPQRPSFPTELSRLQSSKYPPPRPPRSRTALAAH